MQRRTARKMQALVTIKAALEAKMQAGYVNVVRHKEKY
jgi:hypothetical protein